MMQLIRLNRTDNRPIAFYGEEIAYETDKEDDGERSIRWSNIRVYIRDKGDYVIGIARLTCFIGERDFLTTEQVRTINEVIAFVRREVNSPFEAPVDPMNKRQKGPKWLACPEVANSIAIQLNERSNMAKQATATNK